MIRILLNNAYLILLSPTLAAASSRFDLERVPRWGQFLQPIQEHVAL